MTNEEWAKSKNALEMLQALYLLHPTLFNEFGNNLHRYLIACCWKIGHLIPQKALQDGLKGTLDWIEGRITDQKFRYLEWCAEAEAFKLEYTRTSEEVDDIFITISSIDELKYITLEDARDKLIKAAYFANRVMVHPTTKLSPFNNGFFASEFQCPDLLREYIKPDFYSGGLPPTQAQSI